MDVTLEVHPGRGGADAQLFASQLAHAIGAHFGAHAELVGKVHRLVRL